MQDNYDKCIETILHHEGGYVNHPDDPWGETNLGVTKKVYLNWCEDQRITAKSMTDLLVEDVAPIYKKNYWDRVKGDQLPNGLDLCVFDFGVNAGTGRAAKYLQNMAGATADGAIGPNTIKKVNEYIEEHGIEYAVKKYQAKRQG